MKSRNPKWWQVYGILPLAIALFTIEARYTLSATGHRAAEFGIVILIFGLTRLWLNSNRVALIHESLRQTPRTWELPPAAAEPVAGMAACDEQAVAEPGRTKKVEPELTPLGGYRFNPPVSLN